MITVAKLILITVMIGLSWKFATSQGMLLEKVGVWAQKKRDEGNKIFEILLCPFCGASVFSILSFGFGYIIEIEFSWRVFASYPLIVFGASTLTGCGWYLWLLLEVKHGYFSNMEQLTHFEIKDKKRIIIIKNQTMKKATAIKSAAPKKAAVKSKSIKSTATEKSIPVSVDCKKTVSIREIENGFIVSESGYTGKGKNQQWYNHDYFTKDNPVNGIAPKIKFGK